MAHAVPGNGFRGGTAVRRRGDTQRPLGSSSLVSTASVVDTWFTAEPSTGDAGPLLSCIAYAGGAASAFRGFSAARPPGVTCVPVQLRGRETRVDEPPHIDVADLARAIAARAAGRPYALFGHSMGARLAFE